jgi:ABC-type lipoprotein export system ATPase subunit/bifunctional DNA-binding transcriptional regulator/antitoxin component of YhaV-PrlF toxin-antitoxin module
MAEPLIFCDGLVKIFKTGDIEVLALEGLELTIEAGEMVGIVGASGSGKSTLLNVLGGLVRPSAGKVLVNNHNLLKLSDPALNRYRRTEVGFVWQQGSRNLIPYLSAIENVRFPMTLNGLLGRQAQERAKALLDMVGLVDRMDHYLPGLSGGEQQRVAIAVALANNPSILLADEPTGELDSVTAQLIYDALRNLNRQLQLTTLIVSHDTQVARQVDRVVSIRDGKTSSETVRVRNKDAATSSAIETEQFEELTVLDSAGRLQLPKAYREALNIDRRVKLELKEDSVVIRSARTEAMPKAETAAPISSEPATISSRRWRWPQWRNKSGRGGQA